MNIKGVQFGDYHSWRDLGLILGKKEIESPEAKTMFVNIPGADGSLDLTEYFGEINYNNRQLSFDFSTIIPQKDFLKQFSIIQNLLNGKKMRIILDDDPNFYYVGRINISAWKANKNVGELTIEADCEPFKYKLNKTIIHKRIFGYEEIVLDNMRMRVNPTITIDSESSLSIEFRDNTFVVGSGVYVFPELFLDAGKNIMNVSGSGTITIDYQEGSF